MTNTRLAVYAVLTGALSMLFVKWVLGLDGWYKWATFGLIGLVCALWVFHVEAVKARSKR
jgi:hypothetical protein